ncbi:MAG: S8 family serine peptidase, partial [Candidatus Helarchaeota archaeon]|nr:S8 family serine peptidase [Candidatus Helarchaeota archaeon]
MSKKKRNILFSILILTLILFPLFQIIFNIIPSNLIELDKKIRIIPKYYNERVTDINNQGSLIKSEDKIDPFIENLLVTENLEESIPVIIYLNYQPGEKIALELKYEKKIEQNDDYYNKLYELTKEKIQESQNKIVTKILRFDGKVKHRFSIINAISIDLPLKYIKTLSQDPNITNICFDHLLEINLVNSVRSITEDSYNPNNNWNYSYNGSNVVVAVCDSGINEAHSALVGVVIDGYNTFTGGRTANDDNWHGTYVAGIIANRDPINHGVAPNVSLINVKVFDNTGTGPSSNLMAGVEWALTKAVIKPDIINFSGGTATSSHDGMSSLTIFVDAITSMYNILWINAAGNKGGVGYPL